MIMILRDFFPRGTEFVNLVFYKLARFSVLPSVFEYKNSSIRKIFPCVKKGEDFFDIRTGQRIEKTDLCMVWPLLFGSVMHYEDGLQLILSRRGDGKPLLFEFEDDQEFHPTSMTRFDVLRLNDEV